LLGLVALPTFLDSIRKGRRSDAVTMLARVQQGQERFRSTNTAYTSDLSLLQGVATSSNYYDLAITSANATGYKATATARSGTSQANDTGCTLLVVEMDRGNVTYGSASTASPLSDANRCWAK
jgi:type IV pilus assembly protein PilE